MMTDRRDQAAYPLSEAARYVRLPRATLHSWVKGRAYRRRGGPGHFQPLIRPADPQHVLLSFNNLIEAHVLRALRMNHAVTIPAVRDALAYAEEHFGITRLLLHEELLAGAGDLFLDRYGELINLSRSGQIALRKVLDAYLHRIERENSFPIRLYPFVRGERSDARPVAIDPGIAFGRPIIAASGISTAAIVGRIDAGESVAAVAADYGMSTEDIEAAVLYERAA